MPQHTTTADTPANHTATRTDHAEALRAQLTDFEQSKMNVVVTDDPDPDADRVSATVVATTTPDLKEVNSHLSRLADQHDRLSVEPEYLTPESMRFNIETIPA